MRRPCTTAATVALLTGCSLLGLTDDPATLTKADVTAALASWQAAAFEQAAADAGLVVSAARTFDAWDVTPQAAALATQPLVTIERTGDAAPRSLPALAIGLPRWSMTQSKRRLPVRPDRSRRPARDVVSRLIPAHV